MTRMRTRQRASRRAARPRAAAVRPTAARVRDALFNSLGPTVAGAVVLDLFAGTGALGIEALHRGAQRAVFVEQHAALARAINERLTAAGLADHAAVRCEDALTAIGRLAAAGETFDVILLDPPYGDGWVERTLTALAARGILTQGGVIVAEGHWRDRPAVPDGFGITREARYGETVLWFIRREGRP
ncbi:MAG: 16S rRNA (guanine(966)-N(2))-methyltransferase RsmD [Armatimonadetes bacterium]|nr:16S rRNA (guanine(966)-N(2))-methyltransferase RsmD [Armatimonadota bacterium]